MSDARRGNAYGTPRATARAVACTRRRFLLGGAATIAAACVQRRNAATDPASPSGAPARATPRSAPLVYDSNGGLLIEVGIEPVGRKRLLFDTGASCSTLARAFVAQLGLETRPGDRVEGSAGVVDSLVARASVDVPGLGTRELDCAVYDFASYDPECVGILGNDVLGERPFRIEYREARVTWDAAEPDEPGASVPLELDHDIPRVAVTFGGTTLDLRIDTGAALAPGPDFYFNLTRAQADELGLSGKPVQVFVGTGTGGARLELPVHEIGGWSIGRFTGSRGFAIVQPAVGYFARADAVGFLGNSVLDKLDPWFDYEGRAFGATRAG